MIDLTKTTFIIPVKIEHEDRYRNAKTTLGFLNRYFKTNVFIYEVSFSGKTKLDFLEDLENLKIKKWTIENESPFHRTKYLNIMLDEVETPVVVNYDIDVILSPSNFLECQERIIKGTSKVIFPYELGNGQIRILDSFDYQKFSESGYSMEFIDYSTEKAEHAAECGHCIFFDVEVYRKFGGENEGFISYGPEDKERMYRFQTLGFPVEWRTGKKVYHFEHFRGQDSGITNPKFAENWSLFEYIKSLHPEELSRYYSNPNYSSKYRNICNRS